MASGLNNRQRLWKKVVVDGNLEYDYLGNGNIDFREMVTDHTYVVTGPVVNRIDMISYKIYGTVDLWWLICAVNDIMDPFTELTLGRVLKVPTIDAYYEFFNKKIRAPKQKIEGTFERRRP